MRLGIDLGTTRTLVAGALDGRYALASFDDQGEFRDHLPGIAARVDGELCYGWGAARALAAGAPDSLRSLKRAISGLGPDDQVPGLGASALDLYTGFLRQLRADLLERSTLELPAHADDGPLEAMVAVPANASSRQRYLTLEAFHRAGFRVLGMVNEPTAAAIEFAHNHLGGLGKRSPKRYVVVYDLGGGTFDTSAVSLDGRSFELIASEGIGRLGGDDFDDALLDAALDEAGIARASLAPGALAAAQELARAAKEGLRATTRRVLVDLGAALPGAPAVTLATADIYARCAPLIERSIALTEQLFARLAERGIDPDDGRQLGGLYLVGGAVAFPPVVQALRARFGRKLQLAPQPHAATAVGLAVAADPAGGLLVREAVTRHFGVWREGDAGRDKVFDAILGKDTLGGDAGPITVRRVYHPEHTIGHLRFLECGGLGAGRQPARDLTPWAEIRFPYDPALLGRDLGALPVERSSALASEEIAETYTYQPGGMVAVEIANLTRGYARTYQLGQLA